MAVPRYPWMTWNICVGLAYYFSAQFGHLLAVPPGNVSAFWPPSGVALAAVLLGGLRVCPGIWIGALAANIWSFQDSAGFAAVAGASAFIACGATLQAFLGPAALSRAGARTAFECVAGVVRFAVVTPLVCATSASVGVTAMRTFGLVGAEDVSDTWLTFWLGDSVGVLAVVPILAVAGRAPRPQPLATREGLLVGIGLVLAATAIFAASYPERRGAPPMPFLMFPFLAWAAVRFGIRGAVLATLLVSAIAVAGTLSGTGPFGPGWGESPLLLQAFIGTAMVMSLLLAAVIAERSRADAAVRLGETVLRGFFDNSPLMMGVVEFHGNDIRHVSDNAATASFFGRPAATIAGRFAGELGVPAELLGMWLQHYRTAIRSGQPVHFEYDHATAAGPRRLSAIVCAIAPDDAPPRCEYIVEDVTARRKDQERIRLSEERFRNAFDNAAIGMALVATDGRWLQVNRSLCSITGYDEHELLATNFQSITHPEDLDADLGNTEQLLRGEIRSFQMEKRYIHKSGRLVPVLLSVSVVHDGEGRPLHFVSQIEDVSERKRFEVELQLAKKAAESAAQAKSEFLAHVSHEVRTPMHGILGMTEVALQAKSPDEQTEAIRIIRSSAEALLTVIDDVLDFSKIEAGKLGLDPFDFRLRGNLTDALKPMVARCREKGLAFVIEVKPDVPDALHGDWNRLRQVLFNLVGNSLKFTRAGEVGVAVSASAAAGERIDLEVAVHDTGIGIPADRLERIFEPFAQFDGSTARHFGGTGLGLTISARLVEMMGGSLRAESTPNRGSTFRFTVPVLRGTAKAASLETGAAAPSESARAPAEPPRRGPLRILVADDNTVNRRIAAAMLQRQNHRVNLAEDGRQAVAQSASQAFDLILMDVQMPDMDGIEALAAIRAREKATGGHVPIIALTAHAMKGDRERFLAAGMDGYLAKPFHSEDLQRLIDELRIGPTSPTGEVPDATGLQIDLPALCEATGGDREAVEELLLLFRENCLDYLSQAQSAIARNDAELLASAGHSFRGAAAQLGADALANASAWLDETSARGDVRASADAFSDMETAIRSFLEALSLHLQVRASP